MAAQAKGRALPDWYLDRPELAGYEEFYLVAFSELSTCRQIGMARGPIPWRDIVAYAEFHKLGDDMFPVFNAVMRHMDQVYLDWHEGQRGKDPHRTVVRKGDVALPPEKTDATLGSAQQAGANAHRHRRRSYNRRVT